MSWISNSSLSHEIPLIFSRYLSLFFCRMSAGWQCRGVSKCGVQSAEYQSCYEIETCFKSFIMGGGSSTNCFSQNIGIFIPKLPAESIYTAVFAQGSGLELGGFRACGSGGAKSHKLEG
jgi:hypothetical protein